MGGQVVSQLWGVVVAVAWSAVVSLVLFKLIDSTMGLRVPEEHEREGLDTTAHGERAYSV
jgi:Amt family ammonium transporter